MTPADERALLLFSLSLAQSAATLTGDDVHHFISFISKQMDGTTDLVLIDTLNYSITITPKGIDQ